MMEFDIRSIKAVANVALCREEKSASRTVWKKIPPQDPLWQDGAFLNQAAFAINDEQPARLEVTLLFQEPLAAGTYKLEGYYTKDKGLFAFRGSVKIDDPCDEVVIGVGARFAVHDFFAIVGDFKWQLNRADGTDIADGKETFLELYWLYDNPPENDAALFKLGVPVEILQHVRAGLLIHREIRVSLGDRPPVEPVTAAIVTTCFYSNPPRYQVEYPDAHFIDNAHGFNDITVYLHRYLDTIRGPESDSVCNCQDQAAILQLFLKAVGIGDVKFCTMQPFGYLKAVDLVGRGMTNNPKWEEEDSRQIVSEYSTKRTDFGMHAFCALSIHGTPGEDPCYGCSHNPGNKNGENVNYESRDCRVVDSCTGPHTGTDTMAAYVEKTVDKLHPGNGYSSGTVEDIYCYRGVAAIDHMKAVEKEPRFPLSNEFKRVVGLDKETLDVLKKNRAVRSWPDPRRCRFLRRRGWQVAYEGFIPGSGEEMREWILKRAPERIDIRLYISQGNNDYSLYRFLAVGSRPGCDKLLFKNRGPGWLGHVSAMYEARTHSRYLWVFHNLVFDVTFTNVTFKPERLLKWLNKKTRRTRL